MDPAHGDRSFYYTARALVSENQTAVRVRAQVTVRHVHVIHFNQDKSQGPQGRQRLPPLGLIKK